MDNTGSDLTFSTVADQLTTSGSVILGAFGDFRNSKTLAAAQADAIRIEAENSAIAQQNQFASLNAQSEASAKSKNNFIISGIAIIVVVAVYLFATGKVGG